MPFMSRVAMWKQFIEEDYSRSWGNWPGNVWKIIDSAIRWREYAVTTPMNVLLRCKKSDCKTLPACVTLEPSIRPVKSRGRVPPRATAVLGCRAPPTVGILPPTTSKQWAIPRQYLSLSLLLTKHSSLYLISCGLHQCLSLSSELLTEWALFSVVFLEGSEKRTFCFHGG
jgi:hypothetical protein